MTRRTNVNGYVFPEPVLNSDGTPARPAHTPNGKPIVTGGPRQPPLTHGDPRLGGRS